MALLFPFCYQVDQALGNGTEAILMNMIDKRYSTKPKRKHMLSGVLVLQQDSLILLVAYVLDKLVLLLL